MILGYVLGTIDGVMISDKFLGSSPTSRSALAISVLSAIRSFCLDALNEPIEQVTAGRNQISLACSGKLMLAMFSSVNTAVAKQLAKKYLDILEKKLKTREVKYSSPELRELIKDDLAKLEKEIEEVNNSYSQISYI
jgi:hypothetical protein